MTRKTNGPKHPPSLFGISTRQAEAKLYRRIVESAPNTIVVVDHKGRIVLANAQAEKLFGHPREALLGQPVEMLIPERCRNPHSGYRGTYAGNPSARPMGAGRDLWGLHRDGREIPVEIGLSPLSGGHKGMVLASIIDISERRRALMQETQKMAMVLTASTGDILAAAAQVAAGSTETVAAVSQTLATVEQVKETALVAADKARHVSDSAQRTVDISRGGSAAVAASVDAMHAIEAHMASIADSIVRLSEQNLAIGEIIATVTDLAEQSHMLAVNAAIEAAKAGEQGKGFAIVAEELKSLAEQSKHATAQVRAILGDIQKATSGAVLATEQGNRAVDTGVGLSAKVEEAIRLLAESIAEAARAATQIAVSAQQQLAGMGQAVVAIQNIQNASTQNLVSTRQAESVAQNLHELGVKLKQLVDQGK